MDNYQRQLELEQAYSDRSVALGIEAMQKAIQEGRLADTSPGRRLVASACSIVADAIQVITSTKTSGVGGKYRGLLAIPDPNIVAVIGMRVCLHAACNSASGARGSALVIPTFKSIGEAVEAECIIQSLQEFNPIYLKRTNEYLQNARTKSVHHRMRTYRAAGENVGLPRVAWTAEEHLGVGRLVCEAVFETGLFQWVDKPMHGSQKQFTKELCPTEPLQDVLHDAVTYAKALVKRPPMLVPPAPWTTEDAGGYLTEWMRQRAPRVHTSATFIKGKETSPEDTQWFLDAIKNAKGVRDAVNAAQAVPYRVNSAVANLLRRAIQEGAVMGLPRRSAAPAPEFPFVEGWDKAQASPAELELFADWKCRMRAHYTSEELRKGKLFAAGFAAQELLKFAEEVLYFPAFVDWRGRVYFSPDLNPQSQDFVKAGLEFAEGKRLGNRGLFWLKVHVATCAGFDKHDFVLRAQWTDDNMEFLKQYVQDPLNTPAPDMDQCWVLYAAARALLQAYQLHDPREYVCHIPCAMDATCSGLQHWSAILRDSEGGKFTNLLDSGGDKKQDIYGEVARKAPETLAMRSEPKVLRQYWDTLGIPRSMAKRPTMTYVYGAKLIGAADYVFAELSANDVAPIVDQDGEILYGLQKIAIAGAKALREAVASTVPSAERGMQYLQRLVKANDKPLKWIAPTGMPIHMLYLERNDKRLSVYSMGVTAVVYRPFNGVYDKMRAADAISPNFIHSYDAAHMHMVLAECRNQIIPIHDSFATHMCDVDNMHKVIRSTFLRMYLDSDPLSTIQAENYPEAPPEVGDLKIHDVLDSRFFVC